MKLIYLHHPVKDLKEALQFYRDHLGFEEAWREGEHTAALRIPDSDVQLMLDVDELELSPGGVFLVESVDHFYNENKGRFEFIKLPVDIPPGRYAIYQDQSGHPLRIIDVSKEK